MFQAFLTLTKNGKIRRPKSPPLITEEFSRMYSTEILKFQYEVSKK